MSLHNFTLDRSLFNKNLYTNLNNLWFDGIAEGARTAPVPVMMRWFRPKPEDKVAFDQACSDTASKALASIAPDKLTLPAFESHEVETQNAATIAKPFLEEIKAAQQSSEKEGADTLLALCLLLDQMPRNLFREPHNIPLVYTHYDRLSIALLRSSLQLSPSPSEYEDYQLRPIIKMWYYMPLVHSEDINSHRLWHKLTNAQENKILAAGDKETAASMKGGYDSEKSHMEAIERFGRYSYRNEFLGRKSTPEELEYLKTADTFGVSTGNKKEEKKDEL